MKDPLTGSIVVTGEITESSKWRLPRESGVDSAKSDLFAVGSTIYEIIGGYEPFPELYSILDDEVIENRFAVAQFPDVHNVPGGKIIRKCWHQQYEVANECLADLIVLEGQF
ncbi:MAG: hypothetical protein MMC23_008770 [Stictis urceolatum]|nr:hypothetical protein [Stictis urceolata]